MQVFYGTQKLPRFVKPVLTIGTFDGLHKGHRQILRSVAEEAQRIGGTGILLTFHPHPRKLIEPQTPLKLLHSLPERLRALSASGIDAVVVLPFDESFAQQSAAAYVNDFLWETFRPATIIIGYDHRFGHDRKGNIDLLREAGKMHGFSVQEIPAKLLQDAAVSSTRIRKALNEGRPDEAAEMLDALYCLSGKVSRGAQLGRTIGYPTANIVPSEPDKLIPQEGVYAVVVRIDGREFGGMMNIGKNPTVSTTNIQKLEVHIFNFSEDIYDKELEVCFVARLRDEQKFSGLDALKAGLAADKEAAVRALALHIDGLK